MDNKKSRWPKILLGVVLVIALVIAGGLFWLDSFLTKTAREQAAAFGQTIGRPVEVGSVAVKLFSGLAVRIEGVRIGPGAGEADDLVQIARIEVKAALLRALTSGGKDVEVQLAEVSGLQVSVVRFPDGKTNLEHLTDALAEKAAKEPKRPEAESAGPADLSFVRIDEVALREGHVAFLDKKTAGTKALAISHLGLSIHDLRAGKPLVATLSAAVLAEQKNFRFEVSSEPLPKSLIPVAEHVALKVEPIDLAPLAPFVPASVGLQAGRFDADFDAQLGAAVPDGDGPTKVKGQIRFLGLVFAAAHDGKPLDVVLDADVSGDMAKGDVSLDKLVLQLGPASLVGTGKASGLKGDKPDIQGLQIVAKDFDPVRFTQVYPPLEAQLAGMIAGPIGMKLTGAGSAENAAFDLLIDLTPVKLDVPKQLTKAVGAKMTLEAKARLGKPGAPISFTSSVDLAGVDLRPGLSLTKAPGDTMKLSMAGTYRDLARPEKGQRIDLSEFRFDVLADTITGKLWAELASAPKKATRFELTMRSDKLDLDKLLQKTKKEKVEKPPPDPKTFAGLSGKSDIRFAKMISSGMEMKNVVSVVQMTDDLVDVQKAELDVLDGHVSAAGTSLKLAHPKEPMTAKLDLKGIDLAKAAALATDKKVLTGKLDSLVDVKAAGQDTEAIKQSLAGTMNGKVIDGVFYGKDLVAGATGPLAKSLPFGLAGKDGAGGQTSLGKEVQFSIVFANGEAKLAKPITITQPDAGLVLTGGMKLDGALNLPGTLTLAPGFIAQMTGGKAKVSQPVPVKLRIAGQATSPQVTDLDFGDAVATIGKGALGSVLGNVAGGLLGGSKDSKDKPDPKNVQDEAANRLKSLFGR